MMFTDIATVYIRSFSVEMGSRDAIDEYIDKSVIQRSMIFFPHWNSQEETPPSFDELTRGIQSSICSSSVKKYPSNVIYLEHMVIVTFPKLPREPNDQLCAVRDYNLESSTLTSKQISA